MSGSRGKPSRFGRQPLGDVLKEQRVTIDEISSALDVNRNHIKNAIMGYNRPCRELREGLPKLLDAELRELFTAEAVAHPFMYGVGRPAVNR